MSRSKKTELPLSTPPVIREHHIRLPDQLSQLLKADTIHLAGNRGKGVRVAIIDSGFYPHPFYEKQGYRISRIATDEEPMPEMDEYGHGTAQLASLLAIAPEAEILAIKCQSVDPTPSIQQAVQLKPDILVCGWGFNLDHPGTSSLPTEYEATRSWISKAVSKGICVVAAAGNGQYAFPGNMPEVISAGGVYYDENGQFSASSVGSVYESSLFPGRQIPDLCGVIGNRPHGRLLLVPVPPKARIARRRSFRALDETPTQPRPILGWAMLSGTSAAASMIAGAAALLIHENPELLPEQIRKILIQSARSLPDSPLRVLDIESALGILKKTV